MDIASFRIDHRILEPGIYVSRIDGDVVTYDLRTRKPNMGDYMDNITMHSLEHMMATFLRNSEDSEHIIYFGPMGCQTGFYLLTTGLDNDAVLARVKKALEQVVEYDGVIFGCSEKECGNYRNLNLSAAQLEAKRYLDILNAKKQDFMYKE